MQVPIFCREAAKADLPGILRLYAQPDFDAGKVLSKAAAERIFHRMACYPDYKLHIAVSGENIVGTFALLIMDNLGHMGAPSAVIEDVAVDPEWQRKGIGRVMMRYALEIAKNKGCYKVALSSNLKRKQAHAFYRSLGFRLHGYSFHAHHLDET